MNLEQLNAFNVVKNNRSLLLCGGGGVGKSYTLKHIITWARENEKNVGVTATTGSAAILIGGTTIHSFLGIGLGKKSALELANSVKFNKKFVYNRILRLDLLVVDEISMMNSNLMQKISDFLCSLRNSTEAFGGIKVVLCGDIFQLPPCEGSLFFKSEIWKSMFDDDDISIRELKESQRHKDDLEFNNILNELKWGRCSKETLLKLKATKKNKFPAGITPTILYSKNVDVDDINNANYENLIKKGAESFEYPTKYSSESAKMWSNSCKVPEVIKICVGSQVVLTWNIDLESGLCNGARGVVMEVGLKGVTVKFVSGESHLITYTKIENDDNKNVWMNFVPLRLAYAITVNKSQGMTLDCAIVILDDEFSKNFLYGRAYTALSRVRNLKCLQVHQVTTGCFATHPDVIEFYNSVIASI